VSLIISKKSSLANSGQIELILILSILEFSSKYLNNSDNFDLSMSLVESSPQAAKLIQVSTTSFHHDFSNRSISSKISSFDLEKCLHLLTTVKQKVQKLSHHHCIKINFLV
jgi:hypothetical protein